jgi:HAD superfamily hydrolase (TIGR01509 family)
MSSYDDHAAVIFDLDGTLVDNVYQHVMAWNDAMRSCDIELATWRIHRRIGMSGDIMLSALSRELGYNLDSSTVERLKSAHGEAYERRQHQVRPLPGARELLDTLTREKIPWAIASSAEPDKAQRLLAFFDMPPGVPVLTSNDVSQAKPNPALFLAAAKKLGIDPVQAIVVGDAVWDVLAARRAGSVGIGLLSGGYGLAELVDAGAYRVYQDTGDLLAHIDELGLRLS